MAGAGVETIEFDHTPHYKTICDKKSHFSRASDALAEFIDNSVQACRNNSGERKISINCFLSKNKSTSNSFLTIADNGCGMTEEDLKCFAKYSFDQESRGIQHNVGERNNHISKFGVGAKEAGFYLGNKLRVVTRAGGAGACMHELSMDEGEYAKRFGRQENVFLGHIHRLPDASSLLGEGSEIFSEDEQRVTDLMDHIARHESAHPQFAMIILRLRPEIVPKFDERFYHIFSELGLIYHYYLHPEHGPNVIINEDKYQKPVIHNSQKAKSSASHALPDLPLPKAIRAGTGHFVSPPAGPLQGVTILCEVVAVSVPSRAVSNPRASQFASQAQQEYASISVCSINLRDNAESNLMNRYMRRAKHAFRFNLTVPDPGGQQDEVVGLPRDDRRSQLTQSTQARQLGAPTQVKVVEGILFYYPFYNGKETKPSLARAEAPSTRTSAIFPKKRGRVDTGHGASPRKHSSLSTLLHSPDRPDEDEDNDFVEKIDAPVNKQPIELDFSDDDDFEAGRGASALQRRQDDAVFSVFWQDRLVPETVLNRLPCFKDLPSSVIDCSSQSIAHQWRGRIKGFLFFDWEFHNISNNKLKFTVEPSLEGWLNEQLRADEAIWTPSSTPTQLKKWLQGCHKYFDQEIKLEDRAPDLEELFRNGRGSEGGDADHGALFSRLGQLPEAHKHTSFFRTLVVANNGNVARHKSNTIVKLYRRKDTITKSSGVRQLTAKKEIFGRIVAFEVADYLPVGDREYHGPGVALRFQREPIELFGNMPQYAEPLPLAFLGDLNAIEHPSKTELQKLAKMIPHDIKFQVFVSSYAEPVLVETGASFDVVRNSKILMIGIQIADRSGAITCGKPHGPGGRSSRYTVQLWIKEEGVEDHLINTTNDLYVYKPTDGESGVVLTQGTQAGRGPRGQNNWTKITGLMANDKAEVSRGLYCFDGIIFRHFGSAALVARVVDTHVIGDPRVVLEKEISIVASDLPVERISLVAELGHMFPMGSSMPQLNFKLYDANDSLVYYVGKVAVSITAPQEPDLQFTLWDGYDYIPDVIIELESSDKGEFRLVNCRIAPKLTGYRKVTGRNRPILSPTFVETKDINLTLTLSMCAEDHSLGATLGQPIEFLMKMCPGEPAILDILGRDNVSGSTSAVAPIEVTAVYGSNCSDLEVACFDKYMHRTAPDGGQVWKGMLKSQWQRYCVEKGSESLANSASSDSPVLLSTDPYFLVSTAGQMTVRSLRVGCSAEISSSGSGTEQQLYIPPGGVAVEDTLYLLVEDSGGEIPANLDLTQCPSIPINVSVQPNVVASAVQVVWGEEILSSTAPRDVEVGSVLSNLTLQVLDQHGGVIEFDGERIFGPDVCGQARTTGIKISWASRELAKKQKFLTTNSLPALTLRTSVLDPSRAQSEEEDSGVDVVEFSVYCVVRGAGELLAEFSFRLLPTTPARWTVLTPPAAKRSKGRQTTAPRTVGLVTVCSEEGGGSISGVVLDDCASLTKKLAGICLVDQYGNRLPCTAAPVASSRTELSPIPAVGFRGSAQKRPHGARVASSPALVGQQSPGLVGSPLLGGSASTNCKLLLKWNRRGGSAAGADQSANLGDGEEDEMDTSRTEDPRAGMTTLLKLNPAPRVVDGTLCYVLEDGISLRVPPALLPAAGSSRLHGTRLLLPEHLPEVSVELVDVSSLSLPVFACACPVQPGMPYGLQISSEKLEFSTHVVIPVATGPDSSSSPAASQRRSGAHRAVPGVSVNKYSLPRDLKIRFYDRNGFLAVLAGGILSVRVVVDDGDGALLLELPQLRSTEVTLDRESIHRLFEELQRCVETGTDVECGCGDTVQLAFHFAYEIDGVSTDGTALSSFVPRLGFNVMRLNVVTELQAVFLPTETPETQVPLGDGEETAMEVDVNETGGGPTSLLTLTADEKLPPIALVVTTQNRQPLSWDSDILTADIESDAQPDATVLRELFKIKLLLRKKAVDMSVWYDMQPTLLVAGTEEDFAGADGAIARQLRSAGLYDSSRSCFLLQPLPAPTKLLSTGRYDLSVSYVEGRGSLQELPQAAKKCASEPLVLEVTAAPLAAIAPADPSRMQNCVATNSRAPHIQLSQRVVASDIKFVALDRMGNPTTFPPGSVLVCLITHFPVAEDAAAGEALSVPGPRLMPKLKGTGAPTEAGAGFVASSSLTGAAALSSEDAESLLFAKKLPSGGFGFACLELCTAEEGDEERYRDGLVQLSFQLHADAEALQRARTGSAEAIPEYSAAFMLTTDQARSAQIKELQQDVELLSTLVCAHEAEVDRQTAAVEEATRLLRSCVQACRGKNIRTYLDDLDALTQREASNLHGHIQGQISNMRSKRSKRSNLLNASSMSANDSGLSNADDSDIRPAVKNGQYPSPSQLLGFHRVLGLVVDLAHVDDYQEAYLLSWAGAQYMDCVVVEEDGVAQQMFNAGIKVWSLDQMRPYLVNETVGGGERVQRPRNTAEMQTGALPLPPIVAREGNPAYMVNLVRLTPALERLRDTVFHNMYRGALLFDDVRTASAYRRHQLARRAPVPTIFTRDGKKIGSEGVLNPRAGHGAIPDVLLSVFGAVPDDEPVQRRGFKDELEELQKDDEALVEAEGLIVERDEKQRILNQLLASAEEEQGTAPTTFSAHVQDMLATLGANGISVVTARKLLKLLDDKLTGLGLGQNSAPAASVSNSRDPRLLRRGNRGQCSR